MELSGVKYGPEKVFFTTKIIPIVENISIQSVIRPLVAALDALEIVDRDGWNVIEWQLRSLVVHPLKQI
jgi:hypothetical protein